MCFLAILPKGHLTQGKGMCTVSRIRVLMLPMCNALPTARRGRGLYRAARRPTARHDLRLP